MKIVVMGTGGVGGYFGGVLARNGQDVTLVARGKHFEAIADHGLRVESVSMGQFTVHPPVLRKFDGTWEADLVLFCVKAYHNREAIEAIKPVVGKASTVLTLQNGIGGGDQLADTFGKERVLLGATYINAIRKAPGIVAQVGGPCRIVFGEESGDATTRSLQILDVFHKAGIEADLSPGILEELWNKFIFICALSGMICITRGSFAEVIDTPETLELTWRVMSEAVQVGKAKGVSLSDEIVESTMTHFHQSKHEQVSSMYVDLQAGNPLELGVLNGAVARLGKEVGVATPVNDFITACLAVANRRTE